MKSDKRLLFSYEEVIDSSTIALGINKVEASMKKYLTIILLLKLSIPVKAAQSVGYVDSVRNIKNEIAVSGWACVKGKKESINVHLYAGGPAGKGKIIKSTLSNRPSEVGVARACKTSSRAYRFKTTLTPSEYLKSQGKKIFIHAINKWGRNELLRNSGKFTVPKSNGIGHIDVMKYSKTHVKISGWACAKYYKNSRTLRIYADDGRSEKLIKELKTSKYSEAGVRSTCASNGNHRFNISLTPTEVTQNSGKKLIAKVQDISGNFVKIGGKTLNLKAIPTKLNITEIPENKVSSYDFKFRKKIDFNGDGVLDELICPIRSRRIVSGNSEFAHQYETHMTFKIRNGANGKSLHEWKMNAHTKTSRVNSSIIVSNCEVTKLNGRYSVLIGTHKRNFYTDQRSTLKFRVDDQRMIYNTSLGFQNITIKKPNNQNFISVTREVTCKEVISSKVMSPGSYCFYSSYPSYEFPSFINGKSFTSFVKLEANSNEVKLLDLTKDSGLLWNGVNGTNGESFPNLNIGPQYGKRRNFLNMMSAALMDYDNDGMIDIFTVGQHTSFSRFQMKLDNGSKLGYKFVKTDFTTPSSKGSPTEYIKVRSFPEIVGHKCVYVSGEGADREPLLNAVNDHIRCFDGIEWTKKFIDGEFSSDNANALIVPAENGAIVFKTRERLPRGWGEYRYYKIN